MASFNQAFTEIFIILMGFELYKYLCPLGITRYLYDHFLLFLIQKNMATVIILFYNQMLPSVTPEVGIPHFATMTIIFHSVQFNRIFR